jgi:hypothetical protein
MATDTSGTETLNRQGREYRGNWEIRGADLNVSIAAVGKKTVPIGGSANAPLGLVRQVMARMIDQFESTSNT